MNITKRILSWTLVVFLLFGCLSPIVLTAQASMTETISVESSIVPEIALPENNELYEGYLEQLFYTSNSISFLGETAMNQLSPLGQSLYIFLKANLLEVSSGTSSSTVFSLSAEQIAAWGGTISYGKNESQTAQVAASAALSNFKEEFEVENVLSALLHDCPYALYWYDKVTGVTESGNFVLSGSSCSIQSVDFKFAVVADMQAENYSTESPAFDTSNVEAATAAADNAQALVDRFADYTDHAKLLAYQKEICSLVSYNKTAASNGNYSADADPWQLIYVFDGNSSTNVVCEGYSKAFQYLFDLSEFNGSVDCITVTGTISGEGHMWNIVTMNGLNYLTDITNCDSDTVGADGGLFLAGATGNISNGYVAKGMTYIYDSGTLKLWGSDAGSKLNIAAENYRSCELGHTEMIDPAVDATCTATGLSEGAHCSACGEILTAQQTIPATGHDYDTTVIAPTCTKAGYTTHICRTCGNQYTDHEVDALGHDWQDATCTAPKTCRDCGKAEGEALGHSYVDDWDTSCEACGHIRELDITLSTMYRLYNPYTQEHLLTCSESEKDQLVSIGWNFDGIAWRTPSKGDPVYRLYNPFDDWHTYSMSQEEIDMLVPLGWKVDGVVCYSAVGNTDTPIYRLFNPYAQINYHLLTASEEERDWLVTLGWILEGIGWYGVR